MTACAFSSSSGQDALISEEMTLVTYSSSGTSLIATSPWSSTTRSAPRKTWRSSRCQWKPMPIVTSSMAKDAPAGSWGRSDSGPPIS